MSSEIPDNVRTCFPRDPELFSEEELLEGGPIPEARRREVTVCGEICNATPEEPEAALRWASSGRSIKDPPESEFLVTDATDPHMNFFDVCRLERSLDNDVRGMSEEQRSRYLQMRPGLDDEPDDVRAWKAMRSRTPSPVVDRVSNTMRESFRLREFVGHKYLWSEAREYLRCHMDHPSPFEAGWYDWDPYDLR